MDQKTMLKLRQEYPHLSEDVLAANASDFLQTAKWREDKEGGVEAVPKPKTPPRISTRVDLLDPEPPFKSKTERRAWVYVDTFEPQPLAKYYELLMVRMPSGNYTPDFTLVMPSGEMWNIEVKGAGGFKAYKSGRSSKKSLKEAAHELGWLSRWFVLIEKPKNDGGGWHFEEVDPHKVNDS